MSNPYQKAGVDVEAGYQAVERMKKHVKRTANKGVMGTLGGFGGLFDLSAYQVKQPVLVSGTDGVGTKLLLAQQLQKHDTIGIDCVAMCVNDVLAQGAKPLLFLDYIATGKLDPSVVEQIVAGVAEGCVQAGSALVGGETAEMPGLYTPEEYDLAGFTVGVAEKDQLIDSASIREGDVLLGLPSSGIHSNGFSLVRKLFFEEHAFSLDAQISEYGIDHLGSVLLTPTKIYVKDVLPLIEARLIQGISHITGGGFYENIPRMLPEDLQADIQLGSWPVLPIFSCMQELGGYSTQDMFGIFNMGIGMILAIRKENFAAVTKQLSSTNTPFYHIGQVKKKTAEQVVLKGETE